MTFPRRSTSIRIGPWPGGINNVEHEESLSLHELADSVNFIHDTDVTHLRPGYVKLFAGTALNGLFPVDSERALVFDGNKLLLLNTSAWTARELATGLEGGLVRWERVGPRAFFTNGARCGRVHLSTMDVLEGFGTPAPARPTVTAVGYGSCEAGMYRIGLTQVDEWGEESGCVGVVPVTLTNTGGIAIQLSAPSRFISRVYASARNGQKDELFQVEELSPGETSATLTLLEQGRQLETLYLKEVPPARLITLYNGRLYFALGNEVYATPPMRYGVYHPRMGLVGTYPEPVTVLERGVDGVFVVADRTYAYVGEGPESFTLRYNVFNHPGVFGSGAQVEGNLFKAEGMPALPNEVPYWFTARGAVLGLPGGNVFPLAKGKAEPKHYSTGASGVIEYQGFTQVLTALDDEVGPADSLSLAETVEVRVIRHGV